MTMELLAPAGSAAALRAAVQSGADAVYLGGEMFGARHSADNFTIDEMKSWTDYCHLYGVDVHVAVNTLVKEKELDEFADYIRALGSAGVDAMIVQDLGAAEIIKEILPDMALHASTQMTVTSIEGVKYLEDKGFSRVVLARELGKYEIEYICRRAKAEIEVFVHGAICMCYSGQCLMSSILGGRSGNRGRCAQPCRLPYELTENGKNVGGGYILSPKDMALVNRLDELERIGVSSLKIEGRLKRAEYVSAVVGVYRKYLDRGGTASRQDMTELTDAFSRSGFTDGYFTKNLGKDMMSLVTPGNSSGNKFTDAAKKRAAENANVRKIPITISGTLKRGKPLQVTFTDADGITVTSIGTVNAEDALKTALTAERLKEQLLKLGSTPFECTDADIYADSGITVPIKEINAVRRAAAEKLTKARIDARRRDSKTHTFSRKNRDTKTTAGTNEIMLCAEVSDVEQLKAAVTHRLSRIYVPTDVLGTLKDKTLLEKARKENIEIITKAAEILCDEDIMTDSVLVSSAAAAYKYADKKLYGDFRLNVFNSMTANSFDRFETVTLSPELNLGEIRDTLSNTRVNTELIAYGRIPLMLTRNCPVKAMGKCQKGKRIYSLRDRKNEVFPIVCAGGCRAKILNSKPIYMADKIDDLKKLKINGLRLIFTVENFSQCDKIIDVYRRALDGETVGGMAAGAYTRGHFYRGVL